MFCLIFRDKYEQGLSNPISGDPRVDALTSANRILRQRLHDIQKLQENREHALNKAHEMVNGLLNKVSENNVKKYIVDDIDQFKILPTRTKVLNPRLKQL